MSIERELFDQIKAKKAKEKKRIKAKTLGEAVDILGYNDELSKLQADLDQRFMQQEAERLLARTRGDVASFMQPVPTPVTTVMDRTLPNTIPELVNSNIRNIPALESKIRSIGNDVFAGVSGASTKISDKFSVAQAGDFRDILRAMETTSETLRLSGNKPTTFFGWLTTLFKSKKRILTENYRTASESFDKVIVRVDEHIVNQEKWIDDLNIMRIENFEFYNKIRDVLDEIEQDEVYFQKVSDALKDCPRDSDNIHQVVVQIAEVDDLLRRTRTRILDLKSLLSVCDQNMSIITARKAACSDSITTLEGVKMVIPETKKQFAIYMAAMQNAEATALGEGLRTEINSTFKTASDLNKSSTLQARASSGKSVIDIDTMSYMQKNLLDTMDQVKQLDARALEDYNSASKTLDQQRETFFKEILERNKTN